jgi:hypothetical protein
MQEPLPDIQVREQIKEALFTVQALAALALGTVLVFFLPYAAQSI